MALNQIPARFSPGDIMKKVERSQKNSILTKIII